MIVKYDNGKHLARINQIDIINNRVFYRNKGANVLKLCFIFAFSIAFGVLLISFSSDSVVATAELKSGEHQVSDLHKLYDTQNSGRVLWGRNTATAAGVARMAEDTPQGRLLGRRGALTDARRNLLILREKLLNEPKSGWKDTRRQSVSGKIAEVVIHSERVKNDLYFLQVDVALEKLMEGVIEIDD